MSAIEEQQAEQAALAAEEGLDPTELVGTDGLPLDGQFDGDGSGEPGGPRHAAPQRVSEHGALDGADGILHRNGGVVTVEVPVDATSSGGPGRHER
jgi:hypothetical protein